LIENAERAVTDAIFSIVLRARLGAAEAADLPPPLGDHRMIRRRSDRRPALLSFTAAVVALGLGASAWAIVAFPVSPVLSLTTTGGREGILLGLVFWVALASSGACASSGSTATAS
jgi:hypothetical protein